jgi:hypothetical protein
MSSNTNVDWQNGPCVVVKMQAAVAVYVGGTGNIVIAQEADAYTDEDSIVVVQPSNAVAVARAILETAASLGVDVSGSQHGTKDKTAADRQRRHRDKNRDVTDQQRDGDRDSNAPVTLKVVAK